MHINKFRKYSNRFFGGRLKSKEKRCFISNNSRINDVEMIYCRFKCVYVALKTLKIFVSSIRLRMWRMNNFPLGFRVKAMQNFSVLLKYVNSNEKINRWNWDCYSHCVLFANFSPILCTHTNANAIQYRNCQRSLFNKIDITANMVCRHSHLLQSRWVWIFEQKRNKIA